MTRAPFALLPALLLGASLLGAQPPAPTDSGAFVVRLGADTIAVERYVRTAGRLEGEMVLRTPATVHRKWVAELGPDERVTRFIYDARRLAGGTPPTRAVVTFTADSAIVALSTARDTTLRMAAAGALPYVHFSYGMMEQALRAARRLPAADSVVLPMVSLGAPRPEPAVVRRVGRDSATLAVFQPEAYRMRVDAQDRILGLQGDATTQKVVVERVRGVDLAAVGAAWARRDSAGAAMGTLSPLDSVNATVAGGAEVAVVYSRPSLRGRTPLGLLIPYDTPWRTGANAATILRTSRDLHIGGTRIPAGSYSLWTILGRDGAQLVVNRQTGQWGTEYDPAHDLARIPLAMTGGRPAREQFTFVIESGRLAYAWGDVEFAVALERP